MKIKNHFFHFDSSHEEQLKINWMICDHNVIIYPFINAIISNKIHSLTLVTHDNRVATY